jgi:hypothetical protein
MTNTPAAPPAGNAGGGANKTYRGGKSMINSSTLAPMPQPLSHGLRTPRIPRYFQAVLSAAPPRAGGRP